MFTTLALAKGEWLNVFLALLFAFWFTKLMISSLRMGMHIFASMWAIFAMICGGTAISSLIGEEVKVKEKDQPTVQNIEKSYSEASITSQKDTKHQIEQVRFSAANQLKIGRIDQWYVIQWLEDVQIKATYSYYDTILNYKAGQQSIMYIGRTENDSSFSARILYENTQGGTSYLESSALYLSMFYIVRQYN